MSTTTPLRMTVCEFLALPDDGVERDLIRGEVRERGMMTRRNRFHSRTEARIATILSNWNLQRSKPRGEVYSGEAGFILSYDPEIVVGIDVAYVDSQTLERQSDERSIIEGSPVLAVEILSPSDKQEDISEKVDSYLAAGVPLVWIVDPHFRTVLVHRPDREPELFNVRQQITGEPHLPGFIVAVNQIFD